MKEQKLIEAVADKIVIAVQKEKDRTTSGLWLPTDSGNKTPKGIGKVISVGPLVQNVKEGDVVIYEKYASQVITVHKDAVSVVAYIIFAEMAVYGKYKGSEEFEIEVSETQQ